MSTIDQPDAELESALEAAILGVLGRPGAGWFAASRLAAQLGHGRCEVERALRALAERGAVTRAVAWAGGHIVAFWRYAGVPR